MSNERSRGFAPGSHFDRCEFLLSSLAVGRMYPAVAMVHYSARAHPSQMKLCATFLLFSEYDMVWSPQQSCVFSHQQNWVIDGETEFAQDAIHEIPILEPVARDTSAHT